MTESYEKAVRIVKGLEWYKGKVILLQSLVILTNPVHIHLVHGALDDVKMYDEDLSSPTFGVNINGKYIRFTERFAKENCVDLSTYNHTLVRIVDYNRIKIFEDLEMAELWDKRLKELVNSDVNKHECINLLQLLDVYCICPVPVVKPTTSVDHDLEDK